MSENRLNRVNYKSPTPEMAPVDYQCKINLSDHSKDTEFDYSLVECTL